MPSSSQWTLIGPNPISTPYWLSPVAGQVSAIAVDPRNGDVAYIGTAAGGVWKTINGGANWTNQLTIGQFGLLSVNFVDSNTGYSVGFDSLILKTTNGGTNWEKNHRECTDVLNDIFFINDSTGYIAGGSGKNGFILKTTDSGNTWELKDISEISRTGNLLAVSSNRM